MTLYPVILPVAEARHGLSGKEKVARLSGLAREALRMSAERSGVVTGQLVKDGDDIPCPFDGNYWSLSHKPGCVAAVVSRGEVGIDVEEIKPRSESVFDLVASDGEWELGGERTLDAFFRLWTAKEAALKAIGVGIGGLKACRVSSVPDDGHIVMNYRGRSFLVEQLRYDNHIVSVLKDNNEIEWIIAENFTHRRVTGVV